MSYYTDPLLQPSFACISKAAIAMTSNDFLW